MAKAKKTDSAPNITTIGAFKLTSGGLKVEGNPTFDQWAAAIAEAKALGVCLMWVIGDLLVFGETKYGERYSQALEAADYSNETVRVAQWVAKQFPPEKRFPALPFSFHQTVASLPAKKATDLLREAEEKNWNRRILREAVDKLKNPDTAVESPVIRPTDEDAETIPDAPIEIDADPKKCTAVVAQMEKQLKRWREFFSGLMASGYGEQIQNVATAYNHCKPSRTGGTVEHGKLGPITFGPPEYTVDALDDLLAFGGGLRAMFARFDRGEVAGAGVGEWEAESA